MVQEVLVCRNRKIAVTDPWPLFLCQDLLSQRPAIPSSLTNAEVDGLAVGALALKDQGLSGSLVTPLVNARKPASRV